MLSKTVSPKTKAELICALQAASFRSVEVFEGIQLKQLPSSQRLKDTVSTVIVVR